MKPRLLDLFCGAGGCAVGYARAGFEIVGVDKLARVVGVHGSINYTGERELREAAMGVDWMTSKELNQAIPPAYTELIGHQLMQHVRAREAA